MKPALLLDVDGPLNPYQANRNRRPDGYQTFRYPVDVHSTVRVWLNPSHGPAITALADNFDLWWGTSWEQKANEWVSPRIGLPTDLPVVEFGKRPPRPVSELDLGHGIYWKTEAIARAMEGRFFVWIDDDVTTADSEYLELRHAAGSLIYRIDPVVGLLPEDFERIAGLADGSVRGLVSGPTRYQMAERAKQERQRQAKADFEAATGIPFPQDRVIRAGSGRR